MKVKATIRVQGLQDIARWRRKVSKAATNVAHEMGEQEKELVKQRITTTKTSPDGTPWAPWSLSTLQQRMREGSYSRGLLYRTGALLASIHYRVRQTVNGATLAITSNAPYASFLQFGTPKMPARAFIGWGRTSINTIRKLIKKQIEK